MFNQAITDPTAGRRALRTRLHPELDQPITDPTDPRYGLPAIADDRGDLTEPAREAAAEPAPVRRLS